MKAEPMNIKTASLLFSITVLFFVCCKTRSKSEAVINNSSDSDSLYLSLDKTPCFGRCPTYIVNIYKSGYAIYKGKLSVDRIGTYEARFTKDQLKMFEQAAIENRVDTLRSDYINPQIMDFPTTFTSVVMKGERHSFKLCTDEPPESLVEFNTTVERLIELGKWKKISDKTE